MVNDQSVCYAELLTEPAGRFTALLKRTMGAGERRESVLPHRKVWGRRPEGFGLIWKMGTLPLFVARPAHKKLLTHEMACCQGSSCSPKPSGRLIRVSIRSPLAPRPNLTISTFDRQTFSITSSSRIIMRRRRGLLCQDRSLDDDTTRRGGGSRTRHSGPACKY